MIGRQIRHAQFDFEDTEFAIFSDSKLDSLNNINKYHGIECKGSVMPNIVLISHFFSFSPYRAAEVIVTNFANALIDRGYNVTILVPNLDPEDRKILQKEMQQELKVVAISAFCRATLDKFIILRFIVATFCYIPLTALGLMLSSVYCTISFYHPTHFAALAAHIISRVKKCPHIVWVRDLLPYSDNRKLSFGILPYLVIHMIARLPLRMARVVCFNSDEIRNLATVNQMVSIEKTRILPNMIDTVRRIGENQVIQLDIPPGVHVVAFVGEIYAHRLASLIILLKAMRILVNEGYSIMLLLIGYGNAIAEFDRVAARLDLKENIIAVGKIPHELIPHYLKNTHFAIGALTGTVEVMGTVPQKILEYMVAGLPIINASGAVSGKLIIDGVNGLLIRPGDENSLAEAMKKLIKDESMRIRLGNNSRRIVESDYSVNAVMEKFETILEEIK